MTITCRILAALTVLLPYQAFAQSGTLIGSITDAVSGGALPGATVAVRGTAVGTATDLEGEFWLRGVPGGDQTISISYVGYGRVDTLIQIPPGGSVRLNIGLRSAVVRGKEVVVTALLEGQQKAINQQLSSNTIVNVVSA